MRPFFFVAHEVDMDSMQTLGTAAVWAAPTNSKHSKNSSQGDLQFSKQDLSDIRPLVRKIQLFLGVGWKCVQKDRRSTNHQYTLED